MAHAWLHGCVLVALLPAAAVAESFHYVALGNDAAVFRVDARTGERAYVMLEQYPRAIAFNRTARVGANRLLVAASDAGQRLGMHFVDVSPVVYTGISGYTDPNLDTARGDGPMFGPVVGLHLLPGGAEVIALALPANPEEAEAGAMVMRVNVATGDREVVSWGGDPEMGFGMPLANPVATALMRGGGELLVLDRFDGLFSVDLESGNRRIALASDAWITPDEIVMLGDGRLVGLRRDPDLDALFVHDPRTSTTSLLSGEFGGLTRGEGPAFGTIYSLGADNLGQLYVMDVEHGAIFRISPATGNRSIIAGGPDNVGGGDEFPTALNRPRLTQGLFPVPSGWLTE